MREIINDKRYGALKTLGERKQAFNEVNNVENHCNFHLFDGVVALVVAYFASCMV